MQFWQFSLLLLLSQLANCIPQDEIFRLDWQTVQIGLPFNSIASGSNLISLTDKSILSIQDTKSGNVTYRYESELPLANSSQLLRLDDTNFVSSFNYGDEKGSRITFWSLNETALINKELDFDLQIVGLFQQSGKVYAVDSSGSVYSFDKYVPTLIKRADATTIITKAKTVETAQGHVIFLLEDSNGLVYYFSSGDEVSELQRFAGCDLDHLVFTKSISTYPVCLGGKAFEYSEDDQWLKEKKNGGLAGDLLQLSKKYPDLEAVDDQYYVVSANGNFSLYDLDVSTSPLVSFPKPADSIYHKFYVSDGGRTLNVLTVSDDRVVTLSANGETAWKRDESLAYIINAVVIDNLEPPSLTSDELQQEESSNVLSAYVSRLHHNFRRLFVNESEPLDFSRQFGLLKTLVVLTENGKIASFDTYLASNHLVKILDTKKNLQNLYKVDDKLLAIDEDLNFFDVDLDREKLTPVGSEFIGKHFRTVVDGDDFRVLQTSKSDLYTLLLSHGSLNGYHLGSDGSQSQTWRLPLGSHETILSFTGRSYDNFQVASNAVTLPDRRVIYKYLVPNLAVVTSYDNQLLSSTFRLVNVVTGQVYESFTKKTDNPSSIQVIFEENFILVSTQEKHSADTQITAIDLFESLTPDVKKTRDITSFSSLGNITVLPEYSLRTYIVPGLRLEKIALTSTKYNIATKQLIASTSTGSLVSIPKSLLDGRRPLEAPNKKDPQVSLLPYQAYIPLPDNLVLSHYRRLVSGNNKKMLLSIPTELESTSVIISIDTDVFVTVVRPSSSFDTLTGDFNKQILLLTMAALILAIYFTKPLAASKKLKDLWRSA
ncbi:DEKNAAC101114 [Brettanomyces naardenensis]|uniref:ER membrane protein complex subunit 1 n=1 Tax=Brettanomyces naardenensis TaxID=13370 RepID=A0A448YHD7_BRENA|nr:DEKNAAC101114 [Brettanomyces naardenensis]